VRPSQGLAVVGFLALVPGALFVAYAGSGPLYPHAVVPVVFGAVVAAGLVGLLLALPRLRALEGRTTASRAGDPGSGRERGPDGDGDRTVGSSGTDRSDAGSGAGAGSDDRR